MRFGPAVLAVLALTASSAHADRATGDCAGTQLAGRFAAVPNSAGAGNILYRLTLKNTSTTTCAVRGLPLGRLLGRRRGMLPTHVRAAHAGARTAVRVRLAPGRSAFATARFSPDVPGPGEPVMGRRCEPTAFWFRVRAPGGGTTTARLVPPTPVCEHGTLSFTAYGRAP